ncbi:MAG: L-serine ammonia-lyase [Clostridia bacterium]
MKSIKELYKIGNGPSSSHTMGPKKAALLLKEKYPTADLYQIILYGSLAFTGKGHLTDKIILEALKPSNVEIIFNKETKELKHPNTMDLIALKNKEELGKFRAYSIGGGSIQIEGEDFQEEKDIYDFTTYTYIKNNCKEKNISLLEYVYTQEDKDLSEYLKTVWQTMKKTLEEGLEQEGLIPGRLKIPKKAKTLYSKELEKETAELKRTRLLTAYAYATSEQNASGGMIVTAPTCGASGVLPAVLYYLYKQENVNEAKILEGLAIAGLIGNLVKTNASISGAECGCQAEIGTACSMAAAAYAYIKGYSIDVIECAAEIAMEHHLGLTCDPIYGYVQIPCIERNAVAAIRAIDSANMASLLYKDSKISFDLVVETMYETGKDLGSHYRETSKGGLAKKYCRNKFYNDNLEEE